MLIPSFTDAGINIDELSSVSPDLGSSYDLQFYWAKMESITKKHIDLFFRRSETVGNVLRYFGCYSQQHLGIVGEFGMSSL